MIFTLKDILGNFKITRRIKGGIWMHFRRSRIWVHSPIWDYDLRMISVACDCKIEDYITGKHSRDYKYPE